MLDLAIGGYSKQQVMDTLHGKYGSRNISFRLALLNSNGVELGELTAEPGGSVVQNSQAEITRTANFIVKETEAQDVNWLKDMVQPYYRLKMPDGAWIEWPLGVFLLSSPSRAHGSGRVTRSIEAYDRSLILKEDKFTTRYRIIKTTLYTAAIETILESAGLWKINITASSLALSADKEFDPGTTKLEAINILLIEINYNPITFDENGYAVASPYQEPSLQEADYEYRTNEMSVILPGSIDELDLFAVPNVWTRIASNPEKVSLIGTYTNSLSTSPTSTINRGRSIVDYDTIDDIADQTTLDAYVKRIAFEASQVYGRFVFNTAVMPHHGYLDTLFCEHSALGIASKYTEMSWRLDLSAGGKMQHEARRIIKI